MDQTESFLKVSNWDLINGDLKFVKGSLGVLFEAMTDKVCDCDAVAEDFRSLLLEMKKKVEVIEGNVAKVFEELRNRELLVWGYPTTGKDTVAVEGDEV